MNKSVVSVLAGLTLGCMTANAQNVLVLAADETDWADDVALKLQNLGLNPTTYDARNSTPTLNDVQQYDAVLTWTNYSYADANAMGNVLADYVDSGGGVVQMTFAFHQGIPLGGRWENDGYSALTYLGQDSPGNLTLGTLHEPNHPVLNGVGSFNGGASYHNTGTFANNSIPIADWSNGRPFAAEMPGFNGGIMALNFFPPSSDIFGSGWLSNTDGDILMANALVYVIPTPGAAALLGLGGLAAARRRR